MAVEPVAALRCAGMALHASAGIVWRDDRPPDLATLTGRFDWLLLSGVWQHLDDRRRAIAMGRLAELIAPGGIMILSLRHGPGAPQRPVHPVVPDATIAAAADAGLTVVRRRAAPSIQPENRAAGVYWTWLAFAADGDT